MKFNNFTEAFHFASDVFSECAKTLGIEYTISNTSFDVTLTKYTFIVINLNGISDYRVKFTTYDSRGRAKVAHWGINKKLKRRIMDALTPISIEQFVILKQRDSLKASMSAAMKFIAMAGYTENDMRRFWSYDKPPISDKFVYYIEQTEDAVSVSFGRCSVTPNLTLDEVHTYLFKDGKLNSHKTNIYEKKIQNHKIDGNNHLAVAANPMILLTAQCDS